tara:strand:- start:3751 stop:4080 length:330 start_codon:yes stop_codon:yes gene_type:complete
MLSTKDAEQALEFMYDNCSRLAEAKAQKEQLKEFKKIESSRLFLEAPKGSVADRQAWAVSHETYRKLVEGEREAIRKEHELTMRFKAAEATIEVWRTMQANARTEARVL